MVPTGKYLLSLLLTSSAPFSVLTLKRSWVMDGPAGPGGPGGPGGP